MVLWPAASRLGRITLPTRKPGNQHQGSRSAKQNSNSAKALSNVIIVGEGRDELNNRYFKFRIKDRSDEIPVIRVDNIIDRSFLKVLAHAGASVFSSQAANELLKRLQEWNVAEPSFVVATKLGWDSYSAKAYIQPKKIVGTPEVEIQRYFRDLDGEMLAKYQTRGKLRQWQKLLAAPCADNSRLMFAVSLAFTGPILRFVDGSKAGGFQIYGNAESGKTTAAKVAGSVWGCHRSEGKNDKGFAESWHATKNKIEIIALAHNEALLILDETKNAGAKGKERTNVILDVTMRLSEQTERDRLTNTGSARGWRVYFLSTSNLSLPQLAREAGISIDQAEIGRLTDIPLPTKGHGLFEKLHGFPNGESLSKELQSRSTRLFGTAGRTFVRCIVKDKQKTVKKFILERRHAYLRALERLTANDGLSPLKRPSDRFATTYAAGSLAIKYGILRWRRGDLLKAILSCQLDQLRYVEPDHGPAGSAQEARHRLIKYLRNNHKKFRRLKKGKLLESGRDEINHFLGFRAKFKGAKRYYLSEEQLSAAAGKGAFVLELKHELADKKLLERGSQGRFVVQRVLFQGGDRKQRPTWVYSLGAEIATDITNENSKKKTNKKLRKVKL
jgi:uncharacterized protein (DUF927 family)